MSLYDEYLDAMLQGDAEDPVVFCERRGVGDGPLRGLLEPHLKAPTS